MFHRSKRLMMRMILSFILLSVPLPSLAIMVGLSTVDLTMRSDIVLIGQVQSVASSWSFNKKSICSQGTVLVESVIKGMLVQERIIVEYEGGVMGETALRVSDVSPLLSRERVVLFLKPGRSRIDPENTVYNMVGKGQGKYVVDARGIATKTGFAVISGETDIDKSLPLDELITKIKAANER